MVSRSVNNIAADLALQELNSTREKQRAEKSQQTLLTLAATLKTVKEHLSSSKEEIEGSQSSELESLSAPNAGNKTFEEATAALAMALQILEVEMAKSDRMKSDWDVANNNLLVDASVKAQKKMAKKLEEMQDKQNTMSWLSKIAMVLSVVVGVLAILTGNVFLGAMILTMTVLSATGALKALTKKMAPMFEAMGMSKKDAKLAASITIAVAAMAVTAGASWASGLSLGAGIATTIMTTTQVMSQDNFVQSLLKTIPMTDKERQDWTIALEIVLAVIGLISGLGAGVGSAASAAEDAGESASGAMSRITARIRTLMTQLMGNRAPIILEGLRKALTVAGDGMSVGQAIVQTQQGFLTLSMSKKEALLEYVHTAMNMISENQAETQESFAQQAQQQKVSNNDIAHLYDGMKAVGDQLLQSVV